MYVFLLLLLSVPHTHRISRYHWTSLAVGEQYRYVNEHLTINGWQAGDICASIRQDTPQTKPTMTYFPGGAITVETFDTLPAAVKAAESYCKYKGE